MRLDLYLTKNKLAKSRTYASDAIKEGRVLVNGKIITKPSYDITEDQVTLLSKDHEYVSRGGYKLESAFDEFHIDVKEQVIVDIGASTGGFTDVCLQRNAKFIYAVDVGTLQLDHSLKQDKRIKSMENTNALDLTLSDFNHEIQFVVMDVSFISIKTLLPHLMNLFSSAEFVVLIKPQFEAGKKYIGKNGIVKDQKVHLHVLEDIYYFIKSQKGYVKNMMKSKTKGKDGNQEYFVYFSFQKGKEMDVQCLKSIVKQ